MHVAVCTPGRMLDLAERGVANVSRCGMLVFDEADKLLSDEFMVTLEQLIRRLPPNKQVRGNGRKKEKE